MFTIENEPTEVTQARELVLESFKDLEFYEEGHRYILNGKELHSVSTIGHRYLSKPFNTDSATRQYVSGSAGSYFPLQSRLSFHLE